MRSVRKIMVLTFVIFMIIISSSVAQVSAQQEDDRPWWAPYGPYNPDLEEYGLIGNLINFLANKIYPIFGWLMIGTGPAPRFLYANRSFIELDYLGNETVEIIWGNPTRDSYHKFPVNIFDEFTIMNFTLEFPDCGNVQEDAIHAYFDPPTIDLRAYTEYWNKEKESRGLEKEDVPMPRSKLHLSLDLPRDPSKPIQDFILTINATLYRKYGDLIGFLGIVALPPFSKIWKANFNVTYPSRTCSILVKIKPFRNATLYVPPLVNVRLNECKSTRIKVQNRGRTIEQFGFNITNISGNHSLLVNTPSPITLYPNETRYVNVGLITKPIPYDRGTLHSVTIKLYPCDQPNATLATGVLSVYTQGFDIKGIVNTDYYQELIFIVLVVFFCGTIYFSERRLRLGKLCKKPRKPWKIQEGKKYLVKLQREKKSKEIRDTRKIMKDEYHSLLLWYKEYRRLLLRELRKERKLRIKKSLHNVHRNVSNFIKQLEKENSEETEIKNRKIIKKRSEEIKLIDSRKEKIVKKIKRKQEKQ